MTKQSQRILSNTFARFYYVGETRGFEKWKDYVRDHKRKQSLLRNMIMHWMRYQFNYVKSAFHNWIINADIRERQDQIKKEDAKLTDAGNSLDL